MIEFKEGEGLCEYIRRHNELLEKQQEEMSTLMGIPAELFGDIRKHRPDGTIRITGSLEFVRKFEEGLKGIK